MNLLLIKEQIFIKTTIFTDLTTTGNFQMKGITMTYNGCSGKVAGLSITALNAVQTKGSEQSKTACITSEFQFDTQTFLI